jgi:hypothetical protein
MRDGGQGRLFLRTEGMKSLMRQGDMGVLCCLGALCDYISLSRTCQLLIATVQPLRAHSVVITYFASIFERVEQ